MGKRLIFNATLDASAKTVTLPDIYAEKRFLLITNITDGQIIYQFNDVNLGAANIAFDYDKSETTITLVYDTTSMSDTDEIQVLVEEESTDVTVNDRFVDPVSKIRVSNPENLIDTDFEYGLQSTKWETLELTNNIPTFFSRSGDESLPIVSMDVNENSDIVTVVTEVDHGFQRGSPIIVKSSGSTSSDGGFVVSAAISDTVFNFKAKTTFLQSRSVLESFTELFPASVYAGTEFDLTNIGGITTDGADPSTLTVNTTFPTDFENETSMVLSNTFAKSTVEFDTTDVIVDNTEDLDISYTSATATGEEDNFLLGGVASIEWLPRQTTKGLRTFYFEEGTTTVNTSTNTITFTEPHGFGLYNSVIYVCDEGTNTKIGNLPTFQMYYVVVIDVNTIALHSIRNTSTLYRINLTANGVSGGVTRSAFLEVYPHFAYYSSDYGFMYVRSENNAYDYYTPTELGYAQADNPVFYVRSYAEGTNTSFSVVNDPWDPNERSRTTYDYYIRAYYNSNYYYLSYYTTTNRVFVRSSNYTDMGMAPVTYAANRSSLWFPNHGIEPGESVVCTITATTGTLPIGLSSGSSYIAERVSDNRIAFKTTNGFNVSFGSSGSADLVYRIQATVPKKNSNTLEIAANTLNEGDAVTYYNDTAQDDSGTNIGGLTDGTTYYVALKVGDKFQLSTTENVYDDTASCLAQSSFTWVSLSSNTLLLDSNPYSNGDAVLYASVSPVIGLKSGSTYYVRTTSGNNIALYYSAADAIADTNRVDLVGYGSGRGNFTRINIVDITSKPATAETQAFVADFVGAADGIYEVASTASDGLSFTFNAGGQIQARTKTVVAQTANYVAENALYIPDHGFITGDSVTYTSSGTTNVNGLTSSNTYYIIRQNKDFVKFATTEENAISGVVINLTEAAGSASALTGTHSLAPTTIVGSFSGAGDVAFNGGSKTVTGVGTSFTSYFNKGDTFVISIPEATTVTAITSVNTSSDVFTATSHGITTGDMIRFQGDAAPGNINFGNVYFAYVVDANSFAVYYTKTDADADTTANRVQLTTIGTNAEVIRTADSGDTEEAEVDFVNSDTQLTTIDSLPATGQASTKYLQNTSLLLRPDGFALHRPYDGGVELIPPTNPDSQMIRQTRKYFRYQSGKGIQVSFAVNFSPTSQIDSFTRSGDVGTIVTRFPHRLSAGLFIQTSGSINASTDNLGTIIKNISVASQDGVNNEFTVDDEFVTSYSLYEGRTYRFDQSNYSNATHPLRFSKTADGTHAGGTELTAADTDVFDSYTVSGTPGTDGYIEFVLAENAPTIYTYCTSHSGMGFTVPTIVDPDNNQANLWNGRMEVLSVPDQFTFTVQLPGTPSDLNALGVVEYYVDGWERSSLRCGLFDDQNGIFFEYDGSELYCCRRSSIRQISGYANLEFKSGKVVGIGTKFASQISVGEYVVIKGQSHRVSKIDGDNVMYIVPSYRGVTSEKVIITKTETTRVPQADWSLDPCDGTGYTGFKLDINKIQMAYIDYSWYGAGKVRFGFKDQNGNVRYVHSFVHGNVFTEAYMRSGNVPARYEIQNLGKPTYVPALAHWGTSVIMDGRFDPDKAYIFNATSNTLTLTGVSQTSANGRIAYADRYYIITNNWREIGYAIELDSADPVLNSVTSGLAVGGADLASNTKTDNPRSSSVSPYQPYLPSIYAYRGRNFASGGAIRNLMVIDRQPTGTSGSSTSYTFGEASGGEVNVTKEIPLISVRLAPSVDTSAPGFLGEREIINRMQLILNSVGILSTHACTVRLILNGQLSSNAWEAVTNPSLSQVIYHANTDTITGGLSVYNLEAQGGTGTSGRQPVLTSDALGDIATLGNSILGGDNVFPDGPDVLTVTAILSEDPSTVTSSNPFQVSGRISWSESQA